MEMFSCDEYAKLGQENTISQIQLPMTFLQVVQLKREKIVDIKLTAQIMHSPVVNYI